MKLHIEHKTHVQYGEPVATSHHELRLAPRPSEQQRTVLHELEIEPTPAARRRRYDYFGNRVVFMSISEAHVALTVTATSIVEVTPPLLPDFDRTPPWEEVRDQLRADRRRDVLDAFEMTLESHHVPRLEELREYAAPAFVSGRPLLAVARELARQIRRDFAYDTRATDVSTPLADVVRGKRGVCQDFAHLMIGCLRAHGLAGRYVSGYLLTRPPPGRERLVGADASHAWAATWIPKHGWVDFDPTNDVVPGEDHVTVAYGRDFADVTPMRGVILGGGRHTLSVAVDVAPEEGVGEGSG